MARYSKDPYWFTAKRAGWDSFGQTIRIGDRVLYYPIGHTTIVDSPKAQESWRLFLSEVGDEEGMPYAY